MNNILNILSGQLDNFEKDTYTHWKIKIVNNTSTIPQTFLIPL